MALEGELDAPRFCVECHSPIPIKVCRSNAGHYIGQECEKCGPYSRLSGYFVTRALAERAILTGEWTPRDTEFHGG